MLTTIREKAQGWIAWVIVFLISIPFALWGINEYFDAQEKVVVAEINGTELLAQDYQEQLKLQRLSIRQQFDGQIDSKLFQSAAFKKRVLNEMVKQRLVTSDIAEQNYRFGDEQLALYLRSNPAFQNEGVFSPELYAQAVRNNGLSTTAFESRIRMSNIVNQIKDAFTLSVISSDKDVDDLLRMQMEKRDIQSVKLASKNYHDKAVVTESDIKAYYDSNKPSFMTDEEVRVEYIVLSLDDVASQVTPDEEALRAFFNNRKEEFIQPEQRKAQHILFAVAKDASDDEIRSIEETAADLAQQARDGRDFAEMAGKFSIDTISSSNGGDLGFFEKGVMDPAFDEVAFSMQQGEVSEPVRSKFGLHVIKLNEIRPESGMSFDEAREQIKEEYSLREASSRFGQMAEEMQNVVYEQPGSLSPAAEVLGLEVRETDWFTREGGDGIASQRPFIDSAFTEDVLFEGLNSEVVETAEDTLVALRLIEHRQPAQRGIEEVSEQIKAILTAQQSRELAAKDAAEIVGKINSGESTLGEVAVERGLEVSSYNEMPRTGGEAVPAALVRAAFRAPAVMADGNPVIGDVALPGGDHMVFAVTKVTPGDPQNAPDMIREQIRLVIQQRRGDDLFSGYERGLFETGEITLHDDKL